MKGTPVGVDAICEKVLSKDPERRYATARLFERDLEDFIISTGASISSDDVTRWLAKLPLPRPETDLREVTKPADHITGSTMGGRSLKK